jgi:HEAT repeat protein
MMAIQVLGDIRSAAAVEPLKRILSAEDDYFVLRAVLTSLARIDSEESRAAVAGAAADHPSRLVQQFAARLLQH